MQQGTYRLESGGFLRCRIDRSGAMRCEVELADGYRREVDPPPPKTCAALLSDDPTWLADELPEPLGTDT